MTDHREPYNEDLSCRLQLSLVVVTRGDVDLSQVLRVNEWVCVCDSVVWDNSTREDLAVYGRYAAIQEAREDVVLVVDDDVYLWPESVHALCAAYEPGKIVANMPQRFRDSGFYDDHCLVGFGAIFDRELPDQAFTKFALSSHRAGAIAWGSEGIDRSFFDRTCDIVFTALTPHVLLDLPYTEMPWAHADNRMWKQHDHVGERKRMLELVREIRDAG